MSDREHLGELERIVLITVARLGDGCYSKTLRQQIERRAGRSVTLGTLYVTLSRLEEKGCVESWLGDPSPERGGRAKRHYRLTGAGRETLQRAREVWARLWEDLDLGTSGERS
ncbi:MAG: PadR family transcriptional regulator [Acidobacteriota bacterium]